MLVQTAPTESKYVYYEPPIPDVTPSAGASLASLFFPQRAQILRNEQKQENGVHATESDRMTRFTYQAAADFTALSGLWAGRLAAVTSTVGILSTFGVGLAPVLGATTAAVGLSHLGERAGNFLAGALFGGCYKE